jgi:hypothetical protein
MLNTRARRDLGAEEGFALMEVIVSAAVLIVVVLGVLAAIDSVSRTAAANQGKTVAATLAEKDLERLRSLRTSDLNRLHEIETEVRTVKVGKTEWEITSNAQWVTDSDGADISCALDGEGGSYLRITSSVKPVPAPDDVKPVVMSSIVAPQPGKGTLTALVRSAAGQPVVGLPVQADGPSGATKTTNEAGCAVFNESEAGSYILRLNSSGWVDPDGNQLVEKNGTVSAGNLTTVEFIYDRAGSFPVNVVTIRPGETTVRADRSNGAIAAHTGVSTGYRAMTAGGTGVTSFTFTSMFPFETPYEVYSGRCTGNNPALYDAGYFSAHPEAVADVDPGLGPARTVIEPAVDVYVTYDGDEEDDADIYAYPRTADCTGPRINLGNTTSTGELPLANSNAGPGLPFGDYDVCVQMTGTFANRTRTSHVSFDVLNDDPAGTALTAQFDSDITSNGACPS